MQLICINILLCYVFFSFVSPTHIYYDCEEHFDDCQMCVIVNDFSDVDALFDGIALEYNFCSNIIEPFSSLSINILNVKGFLSHAPPFLLL